MDQRVKGDVEALSRLFHVDQAFLLECVEEAAVALSHDEAGRAELTAAGLFRLRRIERVRAALEVEPDIAALLVDLTDRVAELEARLRRER